MPGGSEFMVDQFLESRTFFSGTATTSSDIRSVHDQVSRIRFMRDIHSYVWSRIPISPSTSSKLLVKLRAERAPKRPFGSAYSVDNKRTPDAIRRLLTEGL